MLQKKPLELQPVLSVELIQISEKTNIPYAPKAAKKIIEKAKSDNKRLLSEQAPLKKSKKKKKTSENR